jgi:hypothetical protein
MSLSTPRRLLQLACALPFIFYASTAAAQTTLLDEGTFRILIAGRDVGSETFSIQQTGSDANATINARGSVAIDTAGIAEELHSALQVTGPTLQPAAYNLRILLDQREEQITGRIAAGRFIAKILSPTGEELREYLVSNRAVLVDQGINHQYYFLARRMQGESMQIPVIVPRQSRQVSTTVTARGEETITLGSQRIAARHLLITPTAGDEVHLWVDSRARVLRLEIPARSYAARRTTPPR